VIGTASNAFKRKESHEVFNQAERLVNYDLFSTDTALVEALEREGASWAKEQVAEYGRVMGTEEAIQLGFLANQNTPILHTHDRFGNRIDEVEFHPSWHELMRLAVKHQLHCLPWSQEKEGAHVARTALMMIASQTEAGHGCPISMTCSAVPALRKQPDLAVEWVPRILSQDYDKSSQPACKKTGIIMGMAMTEKQGGSDVRANSTRAWPVSVGGAGKEYLLKGHKWFCSHPMSDAFLVLAQAPGGLSCFFLPRWTADGQRNNIFVQRLKNKLGNKSNSSSEVEFDDALAWLVGEEGRGVSTIIEMVNHTRLDCASSSAGLMRQALVQALNHTSRRAAFGKILKDQPLMKNVLADMCVESEAATLLTMRLARAFDGRVTDVKEDQFKRIATAVAKYWLCKRAPVLAAEALECHGGNGFVEESIMPRLFRESPVNSVWEGSGNVICLDVLRAMRTEPVVVKAFFDEVEVARGGDPRLDFFVESLKQDLSKQRDLEAQARRYVERMALALQGSLLVRYAPAAVSDAFLESRLGGDWGHAFGTLPSGVQTDEIIARASVKR
jgi:putative acyl-CoA dehydrogenase